MSQLIPPAEPVALTREGRFAHLGHEVWWGAVVPEHERDLPLVTVHGGPGICHDCLEPLAALADDRAVYFYDQYGCGRSDRAADPAEYTVDLFVAELAALREALGLGRIHLYAHSYGGPIALEYLLRGAEGVASLTISNSFASVPSLAAGWQRRVDELPADLSAALRNPADAGYGAALGEFIARFVLPFAPPDPLVRSQAGMGSEVYARMHGSSWFTPDGEWAGWDVTGRLREIAVPTLVIGGRRDQCVPELSEAMAAGIPGAQLVVLDAAHLPMFECPDPYLAAMRDFLRRIGPAT